MTLPATRSTSSVFLPTSLRAVFNHNGVNQSVLVESIIVRDSNNRTVHVFQGVDVEQLVNGSYEVILPSGFPEGSYTDTWSVRGLSSPFKLVSVFGFTIRRDQHEIIIRESQEY